ncbi:JmjC domain-containing protein [Crossiella sp. CA198]|uniref:JmjC domain-containing protein n=1 Tax=Crossiella sp. CA198 TaxID=3455607 RepID=UPI003F8D384F
MGPRLDLDDWFAPLGLTEFSRTVLGQRPLVTQPRAGLADRLRAALGVHTVDDAFGKRVREVRAWFLDLDGNAATAPMPAASARRLYDAGTTAYFQEVADFAGFEREVAHAFRVAPGSGKVQLFCNRPSAVTKVHFDPVDVITVQLTGRKTWRIAPNEFAPRPLKGWGAGEPIGPSLRTYQENPPPEVIPGNVKEYRLEPGSVLHVPRGYWHETFSDQDSISLHLLLIPPLRMDFLLAALKNELASERHWRDAIYDFATPAETAARTAADLAALRAALDRLDPRDLVRAPLPTAPVGPETRFTRAGQAAFGVDGLEPGTARISVSAYGFRETQTAAVTVPAPSLPALRWVNALPAGAALDVADVLREAPGLTKPEAQDLLGLMEQTRLVRRSPEEPLS